MRNTSKSESISVGRHEDQEARNEQEGLEWFRWIVPVFGVAAAAAIAIYTRFSKDSEGSMRVNNVEEELISKFDSTNTNLSHGPKDCLLVKSKSAFV
ncbi:hypothetical protein KP509_32G012800 [Ceratopteris richardii]|uniref:Uncharacterized protein n=1 Tax=Ceratopteris richardii TaxID=49495 RepID=A0A8T2QSJ3_CERRI|nr:hypothetical protein KP509_32G012800 [Ceratopteris richardii]